MAVKEDPATASRVMNAVPDAMAMLARVRLRPPQSSTWRADDQGTRGRRRRWRQGRRCRRYQRPDDRDSRASQGSCCRTSCSPGEFPLSTPSSTKPMTNGIPIAPPTRAQPVVLSSRTSSRNDHQFLRSGGQRRGNWNERNVLSTASWLRLYTPSVVSAASFVCPSGCGSWSSSRWGRT